MDTASNEAAPTADQGTEYSSEESGVRQAAAELVARRGRENIEPIEPIIALEDRVDRDGFDRGIGIKDAAAALTDFREAQFQQQREFDAALGLTDPNADLDNPGAGEKAPEAQPEPAPEAAPESLPPDVQEIQQRARADIQRAGEYQQNLAKLGHIHAHAASLEARFVAAFPDIKSAQDLQMLAQTNPQRAQQAFAFAQAAYNVINQYAAQAEQTAKQDAAHYATAYTNWAKTEDKAFEARHPELKDPKIARQMGELAIQELKAIGLSEDELRDLYSGKVSIALRDHRAQEIILDAIRYRQAVARNARPSPKTIPHVQRPGVSRPAPSRADTEFSEIEAQAKSNATPRNMARLLAARRAARG